jgi:hypothetical protein
MLVYLNFFSLPWNSLVSPVPPPMNLTRLPPGAVAKTQNHLRCLSLLNLHGILLSSDYCPWELPFTKNTAAAPMITKAKMIT